MNAYLVFIPGYICTDRGSDPEAASHDIYADTELRRMYGPILDLMHTAVQKSGTKEVSAGHKRVANIIQQRLNQKNS